MVLVDLLVLQALVEFNQYFDMLRLLSFVFLAIVCFQSVMGQVLMQLVPSNAATHTVVQSGSWFAPATWNTGTVPGDAAIVHIPIGYSVGYEGQSAAHIFAVRVDGEFNCTQSNSNQTTTLLFDTFIGTHMSKVKFEAKDPTDGKIEVSIAPFDIEAHRSGNSGYPQVWNAAALSHFSDGDSVFEVTRRVGPESRFNSYQDAMAGNTFVTVGNPSLVSDGAGVLGRYQWDSTQLTLGMVVMGEIEILGKEKLNMAGLAVDALRNQPLLQLDSMPWGWEVGDSLVVTRGGNLGASQNGEDLVSIQSMVGNTITCNANLNKNHEGRPQDTLHCYVGNLSRNITFRSEVKDTITQRGHLMVMHHNTNGQIRNAAFKDMGRTDKSRLLDDMIWKKWLQPKVFNSKISALGQECAEMELLPVREVTNMRGRYSIHLHKTGAKLGDSLVHVTGNAVWGNPGWGITHHDSYADVSRNVVFKVVGAGIVSETGSELGFWDDNLVVDVEQGHSTDLYDAALFHDDYLFSGQGLAMKGRAVLCRGNVIANANVGVGIINMNPSVNNLDRIDPQALATVRPGFEFDQFPLDHNGYSSEGDGVMPVEAALIMENTTIINCYQGLRSVERDMGVNHESRSIFDGFKCWGINQGLSITYQADYSFRNVFLSGRNVNSVGAFLWKHSHNHVFDGIKMVDLGAGVTVSKLVENGSNQKTRNNGYTPWYFIDLDTLNIGEFYQILKEDTTTVTVYDNHGDNPIHLASQDLVSRSITFTVLDSSEMVVDYATGDFRFEVDGIITDDLGSYDMGIKQAWAQGNLRLDYPQRIYEFASAQKLEEYLQQNGVYKDTSNNDQLYFILPEWLPNRRSYDYQEFPIRIKINNPPASSVFANPQIESPQDLAPRDQIVSRLAQVSQSSTDTTLQYQGANIDAGAWKATDGNNNGRINAQLFQQGLVPVGSISSTEIESEPWYDLDLGEIKELSFIDIWNTVDLNGVDIEQPSSHFHDFFVLISDSAFPDTNLTTSRSLAAHEYFSGPQAGRKYSLNQMNARGRYIRIQAMGTNKLAFAEVEVIGKTYIDSTCIPLPSGQDVISACDSFIWINGVTYIASNNSATDTLTSSQGCDSIVSLDLTIHSVVAQIALSGVSLSASLAGASYQWLDCQANASIPGATSQTFNPNVNGSYAVVVSQNGCTDTSVCETVVVTNMETGLNPEPQLFPNPNQGHFVLIPGSLFKGGELIVYASNGHLVFQQSNLNEGENTLILDLPSGLYQVHLKRGPLRKRLAFVVH